MPRFSAPASGAGTLCCSILILARVNVEVWRTFFSRTQMASSSSHRITTNSLWTHGLIESPRITTYSLAIESPRITSPLWTHSPSLAIESRGGLPLLISVRKEALRVFSDLEIGVRQGMLVSMVLWGVEHAAVSPSDLRLFLAIIVVLSREDAPVARPIAFGSRSLRAKMIPVWRICARFTSPWTSPRRAGPSAQVRRIKSCS